MSELRMQPMRFFLIQINAGISAPGGRRDRREISIRRERLRTALRRFGDECETIAGDVIFKVRDMTERDVERLVGRELRGVVYTVAVLSPRQQRDYRDQCEELFE